MRITDLFESENKPLVIKLGSRPSKSAAQRFMQEFEDSTQEHPFTRGMRYFVDGPVLVTIRIGTDDEVTVQDIQSKARGAGTKALKTICAIADTHDVNISLYAKGYADVPTDKLVEYYSRFDFEVRDEQEDGVDMIRYPK
jgi:hypothetical protein